MKLVAVDKNGREIQLVIDRIVSIDDQPFNATPAEVPKLQEVVQRLTILEQAFFALTTEINFTPRLEAVDQPPPSEGT